MAFSSYEFILAFLPAAFIGFWLCVRLGGGSAAAMWLILASIIFLASAGWRGLGVTAGSILLTYLFVRALLSVDHGKPRLRALLLLAAIVADVALLAFFKYAGVLIDSAAADHATAGAPAAAALPLGLSFLVFQKITLLADVYGGQVKEVRARDYLLFTLFFPRTTAGPIVSYGQLVPQFANFGRRLDANDLIVAVALFCIGLFKKTVIADSLAELAPAAFDTWHPTRTFFTAWSGVLAYTLQLYFDFSGYSDMALAVARLFGIRLPINFNSPLKASSIIDFWSRWHITLTRFLTSYIYTPLTMYLGRRRSAQGKSVLRGRRSTLAAVLVLVAVPTTITMTISGIWHGAGWQFVIWGLLHAFYLTINQAWRMFRPRFWTDQRSYDRVSGPWDGC